MLMLFLLMLSFYAALFVPHRKTVFEGKVMHIENTTWIFNKTTTSIHFSDIEKFESDFFKENTTEEGTLLYAQIFVVVKGKRYLIGENQLSPENDRYLPSPAQKMETQKVMEALEQLINK